MLSVLAQEFLKLVSTQLVVRVRIERSWDSSRPVDMIYTQLLTRDADMGRITCLAYSAPLVRARFDRRAPSSRLLDDDFREDNGDAWNKQINAWAVTSADWDRPEPYIAVNLIGDEKRSLSPAHPRLLQELSRIQVLIDQRIRDRRGPQSDLVQAYRQLGHLIEAQNKVWSAVYPL